MHLDEAERVTEEVVEAEARVAARAEHQRLWANEGPAYQEAVRCADAADNLMSSQIRKIGILAERPSSTKPIHNPMVDGALLRARDATNQASARMNAMTRRQALGRFA